MDIMMKVDVALSEVPVCIEPLKSAVDTIHTTVTYNQSGLALKWNFMDTLGNFTQTTVTPTNTGGTYDWTNQGGGMYTIEIPATGGASINNDTEGFGWFSGSATGVLPWRGPVIQFSPANITDSLVLGTDYLQADVVQQAGSTIYNYDFTVSAYSSLVVTLPSTYADGSTLPASAHANCIFEIVEGTGKGTFFRTTTATASRSYNIETPVTAPDNTSKCILVNRLNTARSADVNYWKGATAPAMTGDAFARLGAPSGVSIAADLLTIAGYLDTEIAAILTIANKINTALVLDGSVYQFTANALELAPSGGGGGLTDDPLENDASDYPTPGTLGNIIGRIGSGTVTFMGPVVRSNYAFTIIRGDAYLNSDGWAIPFTFGASPDLTNATVYLRIKGPGTSTTLSTGVVTGAGTTTQIVKFDLTAVQTAAFAVRTYSFEVEVILATGSHITIVSDSTMTVKNQIG